MEQTLINQLLKRATGFEQVEQVTEYVIDEDGTKRPIKEKRQVKQIAPDVTAIKLYLEQEEKGRDIGSLSDEELEKEKERLIGKLKYPLDTH